MHPSDDVALARFAAVCDALEAARRRVARRDVACRELRAELGERRQRLAASEALSAALRGELEREREATREAVDRAAQAMIHLEELTFKLQDAAHSAESLRAELRLQREIGSDLERQAQEMRAEMTSRRETIALLEAAVEAAHKHVQDMERQRDRDRDANHVCECETGGSLESRLADLEALLTLQTTQLEKQQHALVSLHETNSRLVQHHATELADVHGHVTRQMEANIVLERAVNQHLAERRDLKELLAESEERGRMQVEEMEAYAAWRRSAMRRECHLEMVQFESKEVKEKSARVVRYLEASRRQVLRELTTTKRQLAELRTAMRRVDNDLHGMNKTFSLFRTREANVTRTLREYGRRNRILQDAVKEMSSKVLLLSKSLVRSERRKQQVVSESHVLKRGLIAERCQREDLLKQCIELEECLGAFQQAAQDSAVRAQSVEKENAVLQHAVSQLCAYSRELTRSQQALQSELKQLEVEGCVEPAVFG